MEGFRLPLPSAVVASGVVVSVPVLCAAGTMAEYGAKMSEAGAVAVGAVGAVGEAGILSPPLSAQVYIVLVAVEMIVAVKV